MTKCSSRSVLSIATGMSIYVEMSVNLARSFKWWHKCSLIQFTLATDQKHLLPSDLSDIKNIELKSGQYRQVFSPKVMVNG